MKQLSSVQFAGLIFVFLLGSLFIAKVRLESLQLGYRIAELQKEKKLLEEQTHELESQIFYLQSYNVLLKKNEDFSLGLVPPEDWKPLEKKD